MDYSVLMSVYKKDNPEWLKEAIESILNQTVKTNDFVIVEDGALSSELDKVLRGYKSKYSNIIRLVKLKENVGLGPALQRGIIECKYEWIARIDADDYSRVDRIEKQIDKLLEDNTIDIIGSNHIEFIEDISNVIAIKKLPTTHDKIVKYARRRNPFSHSAVMYKKSKVLEAGNYKACYLCEDYDLWIRMIESGAKCFNINEELNYVRVSKDLYKRRGGVKYLRSLLRFKREQYNKGFYSLKDYVVSSASHVVVCLMPTVMRKFVYEKFLRG